MTEVLGVSVAILEAVEKCVRGSSSLLAEVKDVPVQLRSVLAELETLRLILTKVIEASQNGLLGGENAQMIERATKECASTVIELEDLLAGLVSKRGESGMSISKRLKFMLAGPKMDSIRSRLDRQRAVLEMILSIVSSRRIETMNIQMAKIMESRQSMHDMGLQLPAILDSISKYDFAAQQLDAQILRVPGTGGWIQINPIFDEWLKGGSQPLILDGPVGSGKTVLFSFVVEVLKSLSERGTLAYVYFNAHDKRIQSDVDLLRCVIRQILSYHEYETDSVLDVLGPWMKSKSFSDLGNLFRFTTQLISLSERTWICFDGWDQVEANNRAPLASLLRWLNGHSSVSVLLTTRSNQFENPFISGTLRLEIGGVNSGTAHDIEAFISDRVHRSTRLQKDPALRDDIIEGVSIRANGMFLWASLQLEWILKQRSPKKMRQELNSIPPKLLDIYQDEKRRLELQDSDTFEVPKMTFSILCAASRPVTMNELQGILAIMSGENPSDKSALDEPDIIMSHGGPFLIMRDDIVAFTHSSMSTFWSQTSEIQEYRETLLDLKLGVLDARFEGLIFRPSNENSVSEKDPDEAFQDTASEAFSNISADTTLVGSITSDPVEFPKSTITSDMSLPGQLVKMLIQDELLCSLVKMSVDILGASGFERTFSYLLQDLSKALLVGAEKGSQQMAAIFVGQQTRRTASLLRSVVQPEDTSDLRQKSLVTESGTEADRKVSVWLGQHDKSKRSNQKADAPEEEVLAQRTTVLYPPQEVKNIQDYNDNDKDLQDAWMNLSRLKGWILESSSLMDLKLALSQQMNPTSRVETLEKLEMPSTWSRSLWILRDIGSLISTPQLLVSGVGIAPSIGLLALGFFKQAPRFAYFTLMKRMKHSVRQLATSRRQKQSIPHYHKAGNTLFSWTCGCGETFIDSVLELESGAIERWVGEFLESVQPGTQIEESNKGKYFRILESPFDASGEQQPSSENRQHTQQESGTPSGSGSSLPPTSGTTQHLPSRRRQVNPEWETDRALSHRRVDQEPNARSYYLVTLCINESASLTRLVYYDVSTKFNDKSVFKGMKARYSSERGWRFCLNELASVEWRKFQMYVPDYVHVESNEPEQIPECANGVCGESCTCNCHSSCDGHCGRGCYGYKYDPAKANKKPPIPPTAMMHLLDKPSLHRGLKGSTYNRNALPKRATRLELGSDMQPVEGWGLHFTEKVWQLPMTVLRVVGIIAAVAAVIFWICFVTREPSLVYLAGLLPAALVLAIFQAAATLLEDLAKQTLRAKSKKED